MVYISYTDNIFDAIAEFPNCATVVYVEDNDHCLCFDTWEERDKWVEKTS